MRFNFIGALLLAAVTALGDGYITSVQLPDGTTKIIQDAEARTNIQEIISQHYLKPESIKAGDNVSVTTNETGDVTISAVAGTDADLVEPLLFALYYPEGNVTNASEFTAGIKYGSFDTTNRTVSVLPFCNTGTAANDNSSLVGRVVIPPYVDAHGNPYISDDGTRFKVVGVSNGTLNDANTNLTAIVAPNTVTNIGSGAFRICTALTTVSLPAATSIGSSAFHFCTKLASISLPAATTIEDEAFINCTKLTSASLPAATTIEGYAFSSCTKLTSVDFGDTPRSSVPSLGEDAFTEVSTSCKIVVPDEQYDAWTTASGWSNLVTQGYQFLRHSEWEYARRYETVPVTRTINGQSLTNNVALTGSDIAVSSNNTTKIDAALAGKLSTSGGQINGDLTLYDPQDGAELYFPSQSKGHLYFGSGLFNVDDRTGRVTINGSDVAVLRDIADNFSVSHAYSKDELCLRNDEVYRCTNSNGHMGAWVDADFAVATVEDVLEALRTGKASTADATLTPIYSDTPTFSKWSVKESNYISIEINEQGKWSPYETDPADPIIHTPLGDPKGNEQSIFLQWKEGVDASIDITATRTRIDIIGYTLGSQTNKLLASADPLLFAQYYPEGNVTSAAEFTNGIKYTLTSNATERTAMVKPFCNTGDSDNDNSGLSGRVVIPPFVDAQGNGYISDDGTRFKVVGVSGGSQRVANANLIAVVAPNTVTTIGSSAFAFCTSLISISFPAATTIWSNALNSCTSLISISLPAATGIWGDAFHGCTNLTSVSLAAATDIGEGVFFGCTALTSVSLPVATNIGYNAFWGCAQLTSVSLPNATSIEYAFRDCTKLESVDFGDTPRSDVPTLDSDAFSTVPKSCKIVVPDEQYDDWIAASNWSTLVTQGYTFLRHSEWEYARKYETVPVTRTINGQPLTNNVALTGSDIAVSSNDTMTIKAALDSKYNKNSSGIPKTDLASGVQASLDKADSAVPWSGTAISVTLEPPDRDNPVPPWHRMPSSWIPPEQWDSPPSGDYFNITLVMPPNGEVEDIWRVSALGTTVQFAKNTTLVLGDTDNQVVLSVDSDGSVIFTYFYDGSSYPFTAGYLEYDYPFTQEQQYASVLCADSWTPNSNAARIIEGKTDKPSSFTQGHLAAFDSEGNPEDSQLPASDIARLSVIASTYVKTNALEGSTYDFSQNRDIIKAVADIVRQLGGEVVNEPTETTGE